MLKLWGAVAVFCGCFGIGLLEGMREQRSLNVLQDILHGIEIMELEIDLNSRPMPDVLKLAAQSVKYGPVQNMFDCCAAESEKGNDFTVLFGRAAEDMGVPREQQQLLCALCDLLGKYDAQGQVRAMWQIRQQIQSNLELARQASGKNKRLYGTIGAAVGGMLSVLLV